MNKKRFYVSTPIYYVNDKPHIGHAYTTIAADAINRYYSKSGADTFFLTGVDEHGQKVAKAAEKAGITPKEHCDKMVLRFKELWTKLNVESSAFIRTTDEEHKKIVQEFLSKMYEKGLIEKREFEGWYCTPCERYWTEKDLVEKCCPDCKRPVERFREPDYYFLMTRFTERLRKIIESGEVEIVPNFRKNEVLGFIDSGVDDLCISRPKQRLSWGITLPFDSDFVTYVWFDALINYYSATRYLAGGRTDWWPADAHFIGKDILTTHSVYWLTMLMALDMPLPKKIVAHGWWKCEGEKMSKSTGNVVDPIALIEKYCESDSRQAVDAFRYFLMSEVPFGLDGSFSPEAFERRWTSDLSNDLGNLYSRISALICKILNKRVNAKLQEDDALVLEKYKVYMESFQFSRATETIMAFIRSINQFIQEKAPWSMPQDVDAILSRASAELRLVSSMLYPFMPETALLMAKGLGLSEVASLDSALEPFEVEIQEIGHLFARPLSKESQISVGTLKETKEKAEAETKITIDDVLKLGLKIAKIESAERVAKTKKLLKLVVDLGSEKRQLIAGIAEGYEPESLVGKKIVVVTNLEHAKIRGIESQGMLLAASSAGKISLVIPDDEIELGAEVR